MERKEEQNRSFAEIDNCSKDHEFHEFLKTLEQQISWDGVRFVKYQGFWCALYLFRQILSAQKHFKAKDSHIILASLPKSGTTWLKSLTFSIVNRNIYPNHEESPLFTCHTPHLFPNLEFDLYWEQENPNLQNIQNFSTHVPFHSLPKSIIESECRIIYISRNPLDMFISYRHFSLENKFVKDATPFELDEAFDMFCRGIHIMGPFWDHVLGFWNAHLENPRKVLFLKYEDLKEDVTFNVKKIAEFLGCPFSPEEEEQGVVEEITKLCSFENLKKLEVNKNGHVYGIVKKSSYFRKGEVGDWINYLTPAMAERMDKLIETKFKDSGLVFNTQSKVVKN
ncbi:hypothetical protein ABFS82_07G069000 [Erythranthe guttata]|uniref:Sulfotransferase n=1 Tax=Erythranthe guttata TaxID=4155 RepID=A0A022QW10_ERYGU|nr:PREDICTED: cytosolic sulfotransferase 5-like [Erythranthe guttata]EYU31478.1 hypothetical protein MIMGU_mgv1a009607mg [Erythranthe guttata]|eukprot:XP_012844537.1 PREDICTED: cytosolic sulfotransferase 5-like [Erythranthe guttata]